MSNEEIVSRENSKQVLLGFLTGKDSFSKEFDPSLARNIVRQDPLISASLETEANKVLEGGWGIKLNKKDNKELMKRFRTKYRFDDLLQSAITNLRWQDALVEIGWENSKVTDLNLLDPSVIKVKANPNGDPLLYYQETPQPNVDGITYVEWLPKNIVHIKLKDSILNFWGDSDLRVAYETVLIKDFIRQFLIWLFKTNQFRNHVNFKTLASEEQVKRFVSFYKEGEKSYGKPVLTDGEVSIGAMRELTDLQNLIDIMDWCDNQLRMLLQQTPISLGTGGGSRSEGDALNDSQRTSIKAIQRKLYNAINFELFDKMGISSGAEFYWKPLDRMTEKGVFEVVEIMKRSMMTDEAIAEFMEQQGITFSTDKLFNEPEESNVEVTPEQRSQKDASPSRETKGVGQANKKIGTGESGTTREDQLVKRDISKFGKYPYTYEA
jgi:hypothetical protein